MTSPPSSLDAAPHPPSDVVSCDDVQAVTENVGSGGVVVAGGGNVLLVVDEEDCALVLLVAPDFILPGPPQPDITTITATEAKTTNL